MKLFLLYGFISALLSTCSPDNNNESQQKTFFFIDKNIDRDCTLYLMCFLKGNYMYRVATMDTCKNLTKDKYIAAYDSLLTNNLDKIVIKRGKILFESDFNIYQDSIFKKLLIDITEKKFNSASKVIDEASDRFTIELK